MKYTEDQLKCALAKALPETIGFRDKSCGGHLKWWKYYWLDNPWRSVTDYEWPAIVGIAFRKWIDNGKKDYFDYSFFSPVATWQKIAEYLVKIGAITITE